MATAARQRQPDRAVTLVAWAAQSGPQSALLSCPVFEVFYGGARGGGKTDGMIGDWAAHADRFGSAANGVFFRRELTQLDEAIARSQEIYGKLGATWQDQKKTWTFRNGARLKFRYLDRDADAENYQGHSYTRLYFEELTNFPDPKPVMKLKATLRSSSGVVCGFRATGNPGGPGHQWVKSRYIDPAPNGYRVIKDDGLDRVFIPAKLRDNAVLMQNDPGYVARLKQSGSEQLVRAWLDGDWNVIEGAFFDCWRTEKHVIPPFAVPDHWLRFASFDWGSARPFSWQLWAVASEPMILPDRMIPKGAMVCVREWYGMSAPNTGLKLHAEDVATGIAKREIGPSLAYRVADPAIFAEDGGPSIAERMAKATSGQVTFYPADNKRIARAGALGGWDQMRARLVGEDGRPMICWFSTCVDSIRTIPALQHDADRLEDLDTEGEDHAADSARYACMSRPYTQPRPVVETLQEQLAKRPTLDDLWADHDRRVGRMRGRI